MTGDDPLDAIDALEGLADTVCGYRAMMERRGFSPGAAEEMAVTYHDQLVAQIFHEQRQVKR